MDASGNFQRLHASQCPFREWRRNAIARRTHRAAERGQNHLGRWLHGPEANNQGDAGKAADTSQQLAHCQGVFFEPSRGKDAKDHRSGVEQGTVASRQL